MIGDTLLDRFRRHLDRARTLPALGARRLEALPAARSLRRQVAAFYAGKACAYCGRRIDRIRGRGQGAAVLEANGRTIEWGDLPPERIASAIAEGRPVCWACHEADVARRDDACAASSRPWGDEESGLRMP